MDDTATLQRTVRRCTALLLVGLAFVGGQAGGSGSGAVLPAGALAGGAVLYLLVSVVYEPGPGGPDDDTDAADAG